MLCKICNIQLQGKFAKNETDMKKVEEMMNQVKIVKTKTRQNVQIYTFLTAKSCQNIF